MPVPILIVDDDAMLIDSFSQYLTPLGYEVSSAGDGYSVIPKLQSSKPKLVILDYTLPAGTGLDVLGKIRSLEIGARLPVIFLTASDLEPIKALTAGDLFLKYLSKPIELRLLERVLADTLGAAAPLPPMDPPPGYPSGPGGGSSFDSEPDQPVAEDPNSTVIDLD